MLGGTWAVCLLSLPTWKVDGGSSYGATKRNVSNQCTQSLKHRDGFGIEDTELSATMAVMDDF